MQAARGKARGQQRYLAEAMIGVGSIWSFVKTFLAWIIHKFSPRRRQVRKEQRVAIKAIIKLSLKAGLYPNQTKPSFFKLRVLRVLAVMNNSG
ncbi:MAG: hypothetical protein ONB44_04635 [candidate division KSB1 bacterium]|nr:hypothetical protein [candidate division KSB1 bacterium]MDZ7301409.1 hypothetical protein [candidate division KSB1 bacterium]MDZ7313443.1 hypothetical protein [candidate division KSB1 bacterium]